MKFQVGDTVLLLHSQEEGEVVEIMDKDLVLVEVHGIRFPVYADQLDFPYFKRFSEKKSASPRKEKVYVDNLIKEKDPPRQQVHTGVWLSFLPVFDKAVSEEDSVEKFRIYLLNQTADTYLFSYQVSFKGTGEFHLANTALSFNEFYLHDIPFEEMNDVPRFRLEFSLKESNPLKSPLHEVTLKIKARQLFKKIEEMKMKNEPTFSFLLFEHYPEKAIELIPDYRPVTHMYDASEARGRLEPARSVVDLHIEKLTDDWRGLGNFEILTIQLNAFEKYYQLAIAHRQPNLIVVHGIGSGKLRNEIHEILKSKKEVKSFANQYHENFGFGATEIFFQY